MAKYSDEDLKPHKSVAVFVRNENDGTWLVMYHKKHDMIAPVIGKVLPGERIDAAASRELKEEVGLDVKPTSLRYLGSYKKEYDFDGTKVWVDTHCFSIGLDGFWSMMDYIVQNKEPEKHDNLRFEPMLKIKQFILDPNVRVADALRWLVFVYGSRRRLPEER